MPDKKKRQPVTDSALLAELNGTPTDRQPVTDPALLQELNGNSEPQENNLWSSDRSKYADSVLQANKHLDWVKRLYDKNPESIQVLGESAPSTHLMSDNDQGYVFPSIQKVNGKLTNLGDRAEDYARETNTGIQLPKEQGTWFARNGYKTADGVLPGALSPEDKAILINNGTNMASVQPTLPPIGYQGKISTTTTTHVNPLLDDGLKPIEVPASGQRKIPGTNKPVVSVLPTKAERLQKHAEDVTGLAKDFSETLDNLHPEYQVGGTIAFADPANPINKITDPHGDPSYTGKYLQTRLATLKEDVNKMNAEGDISGRDQAANKIKSLTSHAQGILDLQLFNKEYTGKKHTEATAATANKAAEEQYNKTQAEIDAKIAATQKWAHPDGIEAVKERRRLEQEKIEAQHTLDKNIRTVKSQTKYNEVLLGAERNALLGDKKAQQDYGLLIADKPISPESQYRYHIMGRDIIQTGIAHTENENVKKEAEKYADRAAEKLIEENKPFLVEQGRSAIANRKYRDESILNAIIPSSKITRPQIRKYAEQEGIDPEILSEIEKNPEEVPHSATVLSQAASSALNTLAPTIYERSVRSLASMYGVPSDKVDEMFPAGWEQQRGLGAKVLGNIPSDQNSFHNLRGVLGIVGETAGMLSIFGDAAAAISGGLEGAGLAEKTAERVTNFGLMGMEGYNNAYHQAKEIVGDKPEDESTRQLYSMLSGAAQGALFSIHPPSRFVKGAMGDFGKSAEQFLNEIKTTGIKGAMKSEFAPMYGKYIKEIAKGEGIIIAQADANHMAQTALKNLFDKKGEHVDVTEGLGDETLRTAISFLLPSVASGVNTARMQTPLNKAVMFEIGSKPEIYHEYIEQQKKSGKLTNTEANNLQASIGKMSASIDLTPTTNEEGAALTPDQIKDYSFNLMQEAILNDKIEKLHRQADAYKAPVDKAQEDPIKKTIGELQKNRVEILKNAGTPRVIPEAPTEKPKENLEVSGEKDISLTSDIPSEPDVTSQQKTNDHEQQSSDIENGRQGSPGEAENPGRRQEADVQETGNDQGRSQQEENRILGPEVPVQELKQEEETQPALRVKGKRRKFVEEPVEETQPATEVITEEKPHPSPNDERSVTTEAPSESIVDNQKEKQDASPQTIEQQQESLQQGSEPEHARAQQAGSETKAPEAKNSNSPERGPVKEEKVNPSSSTKDVTEHVTHTRQGSFIKIPEGVKPGDRIEYQKGGKQRFGIVSNEIVKRNSNKELEGQYKIQDVQRRHAHDFPAYNAAVKEINRNFGEPTNIEEATLLHMLAGGTFRKSKDGTGIEKHLPTKKGTTENTTAGKWLTEHADTENKNVATPDKFGYEFNDQQDQNEAQIAEILSQYQTKTEVAQRLTDIMSERKKAEEGTKAQIEIPVTHPQSGNVHHVVLDVDDPNIDDKIAKILGYPDEDAPIAFTEEGHPLYELGLQHEEAIDNAVLTPEDYDRLSRIFDDNLTEHGEIDIDGVVEDLLDHTEHLSETAQELVSEILPFNPREENKPFIEELSNRIKEYENRNKPTESVAKGEEGEGPTETIEQRQPREAPQPPETEHEAETRIKDISDRVAKIDLELQKQRASQRIESERIKAAEKKGDIKELNKHVENFHKKKDRIDKLNEERVELAKEEHMLDRDLTKMGYRDTADKIREFGKKITSGKGGMIGSFPGINPKNVSRFIDIVADVYERLGNIHLAISKAISTLRGEGLEKDLSNDDILKLRPSFEWMERPMTSEPTLSKAGREAAEDYLSDIEDKILTYDQAITEVMSQDDISDASKAKIMNYLDWHVKAREYYNSQELRDQKHEHDYLNKYALQKSDKVSKYLSGETLQDVFGKDVQFDIDSKETLMQNNLVSDASNMVGLAKMHTGSEDVLVYGSDMIGLISNMPDGGDGKSVKKILAASGLNNELQAENVRLQNELKTTTDPNRINDIKTRMKQLDKLISKAEIIYRDVASGASDVLNAARINRVIKNTYFADLFASRLLTDEQNRQKKETEAALERTNVPDKVAEEGVMRSEKAAAEEVAAAEEDLKESATPDIATDLEPTDKSTASKKKSKGVIDRIKEVTRKKTKDEDGRKEIVKKDAALKKAESYLKGSSIEDLLQKAKEQTKKPC